MNRSLLPLSPPPGDPGPHAVHAQLGELVKLQFNATGFSFLPRQPVHSLLAGRHASRLRGRGLNFEEIRRYLPGDDVRNIDWHVTARTRKAHVRVYSEERDRPCLLLVDQRRSMFFGTRRVMKSVAAAEVAALAAWRTVHLGDRVGALVFNDEAIVEIKPQRSQQRVMEILNTVVRQNHALNAQSRAPANPAMFNEAMARATRLATHDFLVCVISDGFGLNEATPDHAWGLAAHNDLLAIFIYDPLEEQMPSAGPVVFGQGDRQLEVNTSAPRFREAYARDFADRQQEMSLLCRSRKTPLLPISTDRTVPEQLRELLGKLHR